jgi:sugar (pentulose or hexulose) kinase
MKFIGIDIGSTTIKAGVLDFDRGGVKAVRSQPFPAAIAGLPTGHFEIDADAVVEAVRRLLEEIGPLCGHCAGIVACSQMGGVLLTDADGMAVTNYLSWRDQRTLEPHRPGRSYVDELRHRTSDDDWDRIGRELKPGSAAPLLFWLAETRKLPAKAATALGIGEYVLSRLCRSSPVAEPTLALGLLNLPLDCWHTDWFSQLGFGSLAWPALGDVSRPVGELSLGGASVPCYAAIGDQQAALAGAELVEGELSLNISTGSQVALVTSAWTPGDYQTRPYFDGRFLNTITHLPAGRSLSALVDLLVELPRTEGHPVRDPWSTIAQAVERTKATDLDVNLAFFASAVGDHGHIQNIRLEDLTIGSLFRAAFRNMADNYLHCADRLAPQHDWTRVVLSGGLPQKLPALREMIVERFGGDYRMVDTPEETLHGLLCLARRMAS